MNLLLQCHQRIRALFGKRQWEADMAEEMRLHLEQRTEENIAAGLAPAEARFAAQREFGGIEQIKEAARDQRGMAWVGHIAQDLRFGARMLRKHPGFTAVAVSTLALGIGATTAIFSVVNGVLLRPLAYRQPHELVVMAESAPRVPQVAVSPASYLGWFKRATSFTSLSAWTYGPYNLTGEGAPRRVFAQRVTSDYFGTLGVRPSLGRDFQPDEDSAGKDGVVILSRALWLDQFGGRTSVIGQTIRLDERPFKIIGVMPDRFVFDRRADIFTPQVFTAQDRNNSSDHSLLAIGRLKPGITLRQAREELTALAEQRAKEAPANKGLKIFFMPLLAATVTGVRPLLLVLLGAVGFLLLIACVNVANLLLARATTRQREIAVRVALGAGRGRIMRQLLCESLMIALLGGALGVALGCGGMHLLVAFAPVGLPRVEEISMDGGVLAFACILAVSTGTGFGLAPALEATAVNAVETLKDGGHGVSDGRRRRRLRSTLVILEVALALILLSGAGLLAHSFIRLQRVEPGFETHNVFMTNVVLIPQKYPADRDRAAFVEHAVARLAAVPGISAVAFTNHTLPTMGMPRTFFTIAGRPPDPMELPPGFFYAVTRDYFTMLHIPLVRGRSFNAEDIAGAPRVALINEEMARAYFPGIDPIGQQVSLGSGPEEWREIVGVVGNVKQTSLNQPTRSQIYAPFAQSPTASTSFIVETTMSPEALLTAVTDAVHAVDPDVPLNGLYPIDGAMSRSLAPIRYSTFLFSVFAIAALFLAAVGVYSVMTYVVNQRTGEIGIRMALGAQRRDVLWLIFRDGGRMVGAGLLVGLAGSIGVSHLLKSMLFEVSPRDPLTLAAIVALLALAAFVACWLPARRATKVDPLVALRYE